MNTEDIRALILQAAQENRTELHLSFRGLRRLPPETSKLVHLNCLNLSRNPLTAFPEVLYSLPNLKELNLNCTDLQTLPNSISQLSNVTTLYIRDTSLTELPKAMEALTNLTFLDLHDNPLPPIPPEILDDMNHPQRIIQYFLSLQSSRVQKPLNEAKLILVGQGGVGKTSLVNRLVRDQFDQHEAKTEGISIHKWRITHNGQETNINIWDFGGQEIMHATHQFFLTKRSLYLLVIDARQGDRESRLEYWLKMIESFGGDSPALIALNKADQHRLDLNQRGLKEKYRFIQGFYEISCRTNQGIPELKRAIARSVSEMHHVQDLLPETWFYIKEQLSSMKESFIPYDTYKAICNKTGITNEINQTSLIDLLHDLGIVLNFRQDLRLRDTNVLSPHWVTNGVYKLLNSVELFKSQGILDISQLQTLLDLEVYPISKHLFLINLMEKFELCFEMGDGSHTRFLIPELLQKQEPDLNWNVADSLSFQFTYDVLPTSIMSRLLVRLHSLISKGTYWYSGVVLVEGGNKALVKSDEEEKRVHIWVTGNEATRRAFLYVIRQTLKDIHRTIPKLKVQEKVVYGAAVIDYQHLLELEELGEQYIVPEGLKQRISVSKLLDGIDANRMSAQPRDRIENSTREVRPLKETIVSEDYKAQLWEKIIASSAAVVIAALSGYLVIRNQPFSDPNLVVVTRIILSLSVAILGATIPGFLKVGWSARGLIVRAGGALALFALSLLFTPTVLH